MSLNNCSSALDCLKVLFINSLLMYVLIQVILSEPEVDRDECEYELEKRTTAVFYSITSTQKGTLDLEYVFFFLLFFLFFFFWGGGGLFWNRNVRTCRR